MSYLFAAGRVLSQQPGTERWEVNIGGHLYASPAVGNDGTIYVGVSGDEAPSPGASNGWVYAISPQGTTTWAVKTSGDVRASPVVGADGTVYAASVDGYLYAISPTGTTNWIFNTRMATDYGSYIVASPALGSDGTIYVEAKSTYNAALGYPERLYALRPNGTTNWVFAPGFNGVPVLVTSGYSQASSPAIGPDGTIYVGSSDHNLYAINPGGKTNWVFATGGEIYSSPAIGPDGSIYVGSNDHKVYAVDQRGFRKWEFLTGDIVEASPVVTAEGICFGSLDGKTYAVDFSGTQKWATMTYEDASTLAACADGSFYANSYGTLQLQALNPAGSNIWSFDLHTTDYVVSSPAIVPDGTIYTCAGSRLYAIYGTNALLNSTWPMFRGDLKHTARAIRRQIQAPRILFDGSFAMTLVIETGLTYRVQASTDLAWWADLTNFASSSLTNQFADFNARNFARRYYRLATP